MNDDQLDALLAELDDPTPPPELDARVLAGLQSPEAAPPAAQSPRWPSSIAVVLAAAAALLLWPRGGAEIIQTSGTQRYDGVAHVLIGDLEVDIDGRADITVEPAGPAVRVDAAGGPMDKTHLLSALAGATVTVTVALYQGSAAIHGGSDAHAHAHLEPGEVREVQIGGEPAPARIISDGGATRPDPSAMTEAALREELTQLRQQLAEAEAAAEWQRGQLAQVEGEAVEWTDAAPEALRPERFEATLREALGDRDDVAILEIDCAEDPCLAAIQVYSDDPDWESGFAGISDVIEAAADADDFAAMHMAGTAETDDAPPLHVMTVGYITANEPASLRRAQFRGQQLMQDTMAELAPEDLAPSGAGE